MYMLVPLCLRVLNECSSSRCTYRSGVYVEVPRSLCYCDDSTSCVRCLFSWERV